MQLALPCPPHQGVDSATYVNGMLLSDLLEYHGLPNTTCLGTITYGASTVPLYASSVQARVCVPPAVASRARLLPSSGILADTARVPMASLQLRLRRTVYSNGTVVEDVASTTVQARESDIWDLSGGDASIDLKSWDENGNSGYITLQTRIPAIPQYRRRGLYFATEGVISNDVMSAAAAEALHLSSWHSTDSAAYLLCVLGSSYPLTMANAERLGNWTYRWGYTHYSIPVNTTTTTTYDGVDACLIIDSMQLDYLPMSVAVPSIALSEEDVRYHRDCASRTGSSSSSSSYGYALGSGSRKLTSALPALQAQNAASRLQCGLLWRQRRPAARVCRIVQNAVRWSSYMDLFQPSERRVDGTSLQTFASTIEEDAFVGCVSGVTLPAPLTDANMPVWNEDDIGERVLDRVGRTFVMPIYPGTNITSGNVCVSGGACLYTTEAAVQTVLVLLSTAPQQDNGVYISTRQGGLAVF